MKQFIAVAILIFGFQAFAADLEDDNSLDAEIDQPDVIAPAQADAITTETTETKKVETKTVASQPKKKKPASKKDEADLSKEDSGDTYNFYFQKGSGPGSVEQGGGQQKVGPAGTSTAKPVEEDDQVPVFEGHLGLIVMPGSSGSGLALGGQFNISRKFGLQVHLLQLQGESGGNKSSSFSASGTEDKETKVTSSGGSVAAVFTPVTLNERSMPVRFGLLGGVMMLSTTREETVNTFSASGSNDVTTSEKSSKFLPFAGVSATAKLSKNFGLVGTARVASDSDYSQIGLSAAWLF